jgi:integrase/recombinase XerD
MLLSASAPISMRPMFRPLSHNRKGQEGRRHMAPDAIDRVLRKHAKAIGLTRGYSAHSMRAAFITTARVNGATLDDVQRAAGLSEPGTTKLYDREGQQSGEVGELFGHLLACFTLDAPILPRPEPG